MEDITPILLIALPGIRMVLVLDIAGEDFPFITDQVMGILAVIIMEDVTMVAAIGGPGIIITEKGIAAIIEKNSPLS